MITNLRYLPVMPKFDRKAFEFSFNYMDNALVHISPMDLNKLIGKNTLLDSGGREILKAINDGKIVIVDPMVINDLKDPDIFVLSTICQGFEYARRNPSIAMLIDFPVRTDDSDFAYFYKQLEGMKTGDDMVDLLTSLSPNTPLCIALQPRNPLEIEDSFCWLYDPRVEVYGYPARKIRNKPKDALGNAFVLSFLSSMGVKHVHFLGSNSPAVIYILAQTTALGMFSMITFDSSTWNTKIRTGVRCLRPDTLSLSPPQKEPALHPLVNLKWELMKFPEQYLYIKRVLKLSEKMAAKDWVGIINIKFIDYFKDRVLESALEGKLEEFILQTPKYSPNQKHQILAAVGLLKESKMFGHEYVKEKYGEELEKQKFQR